MLALVAAAAAETKGGLPQLHAPDFGPQLFWLAVSFVVLYLLLSRVALPRVDTVLKVRRSHVQRDLDTAQHLKAEADAALAAYHEAIARARSEAHVLIKETQAGIAAEAAQERARIDALVSTRLAEAEARIAAAKEQALAGVKEIAAETAATIVTRLVGTGTSAEEARQALPRAAAE